MPLQQHKETMHFQKERTPVFNFPMEFQNQGMPGNLGFIKDWHSECLYSKSAPFPCFISGAILFSLSFPSWLWRRKEKRKGFPDSAADTLPCPHDGKLIVVPGSCTQLIPLGQASSRVRTKYQWSAAQTGYKLAVIGVRRFRCSPESCWSVRPALDASSFKKNGSLILW